LENTKQAAEEAPKALLAPKEQLVLQVPRAMLDLRALQEQRALQVGVRGVQGAWAKPALAGLAAQALQKDSRAFAESQRVCPRDKGTAALPVDW
jgi:hypothetical protein